MPAHSLLLLHNRAQLGRIPVRALPVKRTSISIERSLHFPGVEGSQRRLDLFRSDHHQFLCTDR